MKGKIGWSFNILTTTINGVFVINPSLILLKSFDPSLLSELKTWLVHGLMNLSIALLKTLQAAEFQVLTSTLFQCMATTGKKEFCLE